jgi:flagellar hook protein FlgE
MASFSIPLSGLNADSTELNTIANNLSNLSTTGFKSQTTSFEDLFYQQAGTSGSGDPVQAGQGVEVSANSTDFTQGSFAPGGSSSDVALSGNGFFVVDNGGTQEYTRAGTFQTDQSGNLTTTDGLPVMGYAATNGVINTNAPLTALQIPPNGQTDSPKASTQFSFNANLDSSAATGTVVPEQITMYDSLGQSHLATVSFTKNAAANSWDYSVSLPAGDYTGAATNNTGALTFNSAGQLTTPAANVAGIGFAGLTDGASNLSFNWNLYDSNNNPTLTQVASASTSSGTNQDGYASGSSTGFNIDPTGTISVQFSNGQTQAVGQLAVASVNNEQGLQRLGGGNYAATIASGQPTLGVAGDGGRGTIEGGELEGSNVNISTEFSNLIVAQNAYEANAKSVSTFDTVLQATINMIQA